MNIIQRILQTHSRQQHLSSDTTPGNALPAVVLDHMPDAVAVTDSALQVIYMNKKAESLSCHDDLSSKMQIEDVFTLTSVTDGARIVNIAQKAFTSDIPVMTTQDCILLTKQGKEKYIQASAMPYHNSHGDTVGVIFTIKDFTALNNLLERQEQYIRTDRFSNLLSIDEIISLTTKSTVNIDTKRSNLVVYVRVKIPESAGYSFVQHRDAIQTISEKIEACVAEYRGNAGYLGDGRFAILFTTINTYSLSHIIDRMHRQLCELLHDTDVLVVSVRSGYIVDTGLGLTGETLITMAEQASCEIDKDHPISPYRDEVISNQC